MSINGYTFVDNSQLSITQKIQLYFAKNPCTSTSANSSTSSLDLDESLLKTFEESKHRSKLNYTKPITANDIVDLSSPPAQVPQVQQFEQNLIDLCTPPPLIDLTCDMNTPKSTEKSTIKLIAKQLDFDKTETEIDIISTPPQSTSRGTKMSMLYVSDESFLAMEKWCEEQEDSPNKSSPQTSIFKSSFANETHLSDIEEPSELWNLTKYDASPCKKINFNRPSTIIEESTQCSSSNGSNVTDTSSASSNRHESIDVPTDVSKSKDNLQITEMISLTNRPNFLNPQQNVKKDKLKMNEIATMRQNLLSLPHHQHSNKENFQIKNEIAKKKLPNYRESIFNVFPKNKTKRQYYQSPESAAATTESGSTMKRLEKNISVMSFDDYKDECQSSTNESDLFNETSPQSPLSPMHSIESNDTSPNLNDTMEAVDFFIEQGRKLQSGAKTPKPSVATFSPKIRNCLSSSQKTMKPRTPTEILRANHLRRNLMDSTMVELFTKDK